MDELRIALEVIQEYVDESLFEPKRNWPEDEFYKRCCERWAANELMLFLQQHWYESTPVRLISSFINRLDDYSGVHEDTQPSEGFIFARDVVKDIFYLFV